MTCDYDRVAERFVARYHARTGPGGLFHLDWLDPFDVRRPGEEPNLAAFGPGTYAGVVWSARRDDPDAAIAPTREALRLAAPASAAGRVTPYGTGEPVAWLWERRAAVVLEIRRDCPDHGARGAVALALGWVW